MSNQDSTREFHDELLSAYLDGELLPAERTRVEERIAVDPVARQMLDELRSVSRAMQSLPRKQVGEDLRPAILERTKQAQLANAEAKSHSTIEVSTASSALAGGSASPAFTVGRSRRGWFWAAMAVAAALLVSFLQRETLQPELPKVADRNSDRAPQAAEEVATDKFVHDESDVRRLKELEESHGVMLNKEPATVSIADGTQQPSNTDFAATGAATRPTASAGDALKDGIANGLAKEKESQPEIAMDSTGAWFDGKGPEKADQKQTLGLDMREGTSAAQRGGNALNRFSGGDDIAMPGAAAGQQGLNDASGSSRKVDDLAAISGTITAGTTNTSATPAPATPTAAPTSAAPNSGSTSSRDGVLIVYVDVKPAAFRARAIDAKLATSGIAIEPAPAAAAEMPGRESELALQSANEVHLYFGESLRTADPSQMDAILVDAPASQIDGLLAALDADADNVVSISIDDRQLAGNQSKSAQLAGVDWSRFKRATMPDELRLLSRRADERSLAMTDSFGTDTSALGTEMAGSRRGGRGRAGGGAGGGAVARGGGGRGGRAAGARGAQRGRGASVAETPAAGEPAAMKQGSGDQPAGQDYQELINTRAEKAATAPTESQLGDLKAAAEDANAKDTSAKGSVAPTASAADSIKTPTEPTRGEGSTRYGFGGMSNFGGGGGGQPQPSGGRTPESGAAGVVSGPAAAGRATRLALSPQPTQGEPLSEINLKRDSASYGLDQNARPLDGIRPDATKSADTPTATPGQEKLAENAVSGTVTENRAFVARPLDAESISGGRTSGGELARGTTGGELGTNLAGSASAAPQSRASIERQRAAAQQSPRADTLQVLLVLRPQPATATLPAADTTGKPASSLPADDKAK